MNLAIEKGVKSTIADKALLACSLLLLALVIAFYAGQRGSSADLARLVKRVDAARQEMKVVQAQPDAASLQKQLDQLRSQAMSFPTYAQAEDMATSLWAWARDSGVSLDKMGYSIRSTRIGDWAYPAHSFPLAGQGKPAALAEFISRMEQSSLRMAAVTQLQLSQASDGRWSFSMIYVIWSQGSKLEAKTGR